MANRNIYWQRGLAKVANLQRAEDTMVSAVNETLAALKLTPMDSANALLARKYAKVIDEHDDLAAAMDRYGPKLFACLEVLGAGHSPKGKGVTPNVPAPRKSKLQELRENRR